MSEPKYIEVGGRIHSIATGNVTTGANEIFDDDKNKKQNEINTETYSLVNNINERLNSLSPDQQSALSVATKATNNETKLGYYVCETEGNIATKVIAPATGYVLSTGGSIKVKMINANTAADATLNINSTGVKALYYDGERVSVNNTWKAGETVEIYYDGTSYYANNVANSSDNGAFDVSAKYPTSGVEGGNTYTLQGALAVLNTNLSANKKKGGMSIKFIQNSDNKYVQYRLTAYSWSTTESDWQGVDDKPTVGSQNVIKSGGVANTVNELKKATLGILSPMYYQGGIIEGKQNAGNLRVRIGPIRESINLSFSADIFPAYLYKYVEGKSPADVELSAADYVYRPLSDTTTHIEYDPAYPNLYVVFRRLDATAQLLIDDVKEAVIIHNESSLNKRISSLEDKDNTPTKNSDKLVTSNGVLDAIGIYKISVHKEVGGNVSFYIQQSDYGKNVAIRILKHTLAWTGSIICDFSVGDNHNYRLVTEGDYIRFEAESSVTRLYIYLQNGAITEAGDIEFEVVYGSTYERYLSLKDNIASIEGNITSVKENIASIEGNIASIEGKDNALSVLNGYFVYEDGSFVAHDGFRSRVFKTKGIISLDCECGHNAETNVVIGFFNSDTPSAESYIKEGSIPSTTIPNDSVVGTKYHLNAEDIPQGAVTVVITNRNKSLDDTLYHKISIKKVKDYALKSDVPDIKPINTRLNEIDYEPMDVSLVQGGYISGIPNLNNVRVRIDRIIKKSELPMKVVVPNDIDVRLYGYSLYSTEDDYSSFVSWNPVQTAYWKEMEITEETLGENEGVTIMFCKQSDYSDTLYVEECKGVLLVHQDGKLTTLQAEVKALEESVQNAIEEGNTIYYGRKQTLKITDEMHKMNNVLICSHIHRDYPYTTKNQSIAVWDNKCFCFNDTNFASNGFCIVIDGVTGEVIERVLDVPSVVSSAGEGASHLNNACFTDQYYTAQDKYPLLLLSRGDYARTNSEVGKRMYILRVVEEDSHFTFTHIKTIIADHNYLTTFNPSWDYDAQRKMIWGHLHSQDWRWGDNVGNVYTSFNMPGSLLFKAYGASYVCIESRDAAAVAANVTISIGNETKTIAVNVGDKISEIFPYSEGVGGCVYIMCSQDAQAFTERYDVYKCDQDGNGKVRIVMENYIAGFKAPDLADPTTVTISNSEFTNPASVGQGIFQGGCCANGKMYLPFQNYKKINGHPVDYTGNVCLIVDPVSGYVESMIRLASQNEPEGCAIYNGELYISHHNGAATDETASPAFELYKYSFD